MSNNSEVLTQKIIDHFRGHGSSYKEGWFYQNQNYDINHIIKKHLSETTFSSEWIDSLWKWNQNTFGPGKRTKGCVDHIRKELVEIEKEPDDSEEWVDVLLLALNGLQRLEMSGNDILTAVESKVRKNKNRNWPDWRTMPEDKAIEHKK